MVHNEAFDDLSDLPPQVPCLCPLRGEGETVVYEGPLLVGSKTYAGSLVLGRGSRSGLSAKFEGSHGEYGDLFFRDRELSKVELPPDPVLKKPFAASTDCDKAKPQVSSTISVSSTSGGDLGAVDHFLIGCSTYLVPILPATAVAEGMQRQQEFSLPGWNLLLALASANDEHELVVKAIPDGSFSVDAERLDTLSLNLFYLLSFLAAREVGIGPILGLDSSGSIVWAEFSSKRERPGNPGFRWCPDTAMGEALAATSAGFSLMLEDPAMEKLLTRSIEAFIFANSSEVLDVRIPIICTGLETLAWAYLRRCKKVGRKAVKKMQLGEMLNRLLETAKISMVIPDHFEALKSRAEKVPELRDATAPEVLAHVRNGLVHPPKKLKDPKWPKGDELVEAWQLATWYLELILLLWLQYDGEYLRRTDLWNGTVDPQVVPWAAESHEEPAK